MVVSRVTVLASASSSTSPSSSLCRLLVVVVVVSGLLSVVVVLVVVETFLAFLSRNCFETRTFSLWPGATDDKVDAGVVECTEGGAKASNLLMLLTAFTLTL